MPRDDPLVMHVKSHDESKEFNRYFKRAKVVGHNMKFEVDFLDGDVLLDENVALKKGVSSSGDAVYAPSTDARYPSSLATDGQLGERRYSDCIETSASNPNWWRVDLDDVVLIHDVTIYFRLDFTPRRNGIQVYLTNTTITPSGILCYTVTGNTFGTDINDTLSVPCHGRGRYVLLYTTTANKGDTQPVLDFCEVEVDVCDPGTYGADCENYCHCKHGVCNDMTGVCPPGGCLAGWKGTNCSVECVGNVEYGPDCGGTCSARKCKEAASTCPRDTGRCDGGCEPGWEGEDCTSECSSTYGDECSKNCSSRNCGTASSTCDHVTGACDHGCSAGWKDVDCVTVCVDGTEYGVRCVKLCRSRMCQGDTSICPQDTGQCTDGCQTGWKGEDCTEACIDGVEYGAGCVNNCSARKCKEAGIPCPRDTGRCDGGCQPGWEGEDCRSGVSHLHVRPLLCVPFIRICASYSWTIEL
ncbi:cell death abnormality protein 1-like [Haliotis asinina]|uniref:cell death abnormality protein 1-like n=1 Tax=Haliotis asinina TaxID=109174 RepID=UPI003531BA62